MRPQIVDNSIYLFPNSKGGSLDHLTRHIQNLATSNLGRHAAATAVVCRGTEMQQNAVSVMMSHSASTQKLIYSANKGPREAVEGFTAMEGLRGKGRMEQRKERFSTTEVGDIQLYFGNSMAAGKVPGIAECREFVMNHSSTKTAKQIRDKVRNLIGRK